MPKGINEYLHQIYLDDGFNRMHWAAVQMARDIGVHAFGLFPDVLIRTRRPNEAADAFEYRCSVYEPITQKYIGKVCTELNKIRRSTDWGILFKSENVPPKLLNDALDNSLENYLTYNLPGFTSLTNWLFSLALPAYLVDANAFIVVTPTDVNGDTSEYTTPQPEIIPSSLVKYYIPNEILIYISEEKCEYWLYPEDAKQEKQLMVGDVLYIITPTVYARYEQATADYRLKKVWEYEHKLNYMPVAQTGGIVREKSNNRVLYKSRIADMVPDLNEAAREYSDVQAEAVNVIYSERWEIEEDECKACNGSGEEPGTGVGFMNACQPCKKCNGTGHKARSPFTKIVVKRPDALAGDSAQIPNPPAGYIEKSTDIIKIQDARVKQHIADALSAINMSFLEDIPLAESGRAKEVDRDALNTFVHSVAEDLVRIADDVVKFINDMRYKIAVPDDKTRAAMLPYIIVPEAYDILSSDYLLKELADAQQSNVSPIIINALEKEFAAKKFNANPLIRQQLELTLSLDPLSGITDEDKLTRLSAKGITQESYIISSNVTEFVNRALQANKDFYLWETEKQKELFKEYAREVMQQQTNDLVNAIQ